MNPFFFSKLIKG